MKKSEIKRKTPLARGAGLRQGSQLERRTGLSPVSKKRAKINRQRAKALEEAWGPRPWRCRFVDFTRCWTKEGLSFFAIAEADLRCFGPVNAHEILKRSRSGSDENVLDPSGMVPLCDGHNGWVEDHPVKAEAMGLSLPSNN